jgi:hypothetical protein
LLLGGALSKTSSRKSLSVWYTPRACKDDANKIIISIIHVKENKKFLFKLSIYGFLSSVGLILQHNPIHPSIDYRFFEFLLKATANNFHLTSSFSPLIFI